MRRASAPYQSAMLAAPEARALEFELPLQLLDLQPGMRLLDLPSGGGYLKRHLPESVVHVPAETVASYADYEQVLLCDWDSIPLPDGQIDAALSLAALHHLTDRRQACYREIHRVMRPGGVFVIADVGVGSGPAQWLDNFVAAYSSEGHAAVFFEADTDSAQLRAGGFDVVSAETKAYPWRFDSRKQMVDFCRGLFRLDLPNDAQIEQAIEDLLGVDEHVGGRVEMQWSLMHFKALRL